jgi:hypothetical protein
LFVIFPPPISYEINKIILAIRVINNGSLTFYPEPAVYDPTLNTQIFQGMSSFIS